MLLGFLLGHALHVHLIGVDVGLSLLYASRAGAKPCCSQGLCRTNLARKSGGVDRICRSLMCWFIGLSPSLTRTNLANPKKECPEKIIKILDQAISIVISYIYRGFMPKSRFFLFG